MGSFTLTKRYDDLDTPVQRSEPLPLLHIAAMTLITLAAFAIRLWFNFIFPHVNAYNSCDASEYLANAQAIVDAWKLPTSFWSTSITYLTGHASPEVVAQMHSWLAPLQDLRISGPVFPLFLSIPLILYHQGTTLAPWTLPLVAQCIVSALTCLFIGLTASRTFCKRAGYLAALVAAAYPAFVINSGRLYSETFAAFLLSLLCYQIVRGFTGAPDERSFAKSSFVTGAVAACLQLTRSIMVSLTILALPAVIFQQGLRKGCFGLVGFILGFWLVIMPWLAFQKLAFGSASLIVDRVGHYNMFVGNNTLTQGWLSVPYPDGRGIEDKPLTQLLKESCKESPSHFWNLLLDKQLRLWETPWNDFRASLGRINSKAQIWWHQITLLLAAVGICLGFVAVGGSRQDEYDLKAKQRDAGNAGAKLFLLLVLAIHFAYLFFITVPRYNLTAMVVACVFAGGGIDAIFKLLSQRNGPVSALALLAAGCLVIAVPKLPLVNIFATLLGGDHAFMGLVALQVASFAALLCLSAALMMCVSAFVDRQFGQQPRGGGPARLMIVALTLLCAPSFLLHAHASGRWYEWQCPMQAAGQTITQTFSLPAGFAQSMAGRQLYLIVDADSGSKLQNQSVTIDGAALDAPALPGLSLIGDLSRYHVQNSTLMGEVEWIVLSLCQAAGMANTDLRQWFIYPLPSDNLAKQQAIKVQLTSTADRGATIFGTYNVDRDAVLVPALTLASWEKAFYGVENDGGFSDPRYDYRLPSMAATNYDLDLSPVPGMQTGRYNIHLLAGPFVSTPAPEPTTVPSTKPDAVKHPSSNSARAKQPTGSTIAKQPSNSTGAKQPPAGAINNSKSAAAPASAGPNDAAAASADAVSAPPPPPISPSRASIILTKQVPLTRLALDGAPANWIQNPLPAFDDASGDAMWIVRVSGQARLPEQRARLTLNVQAAGTSAQTYLSPWIAPAKVGPQWTSFDMCAPLHPKTLTNHPDKLLFNLNAESLNQHWQAASSDNVELQNVRLQIWRLPANPTGPGHLMY